MAAIPRVSTQMLYCALVLLVGCARLAELRVSGRHQARLLRDGGLLVGGDRYPLMVGFHVLFLAACPAEVLCFERPFIALLGIPMLTILALATGLRYWAIGTLGPRWSTRVIVPRNFVLVRTGPYRYLRHPNYLAVAAETIALPLVHTAWLTAALASVANAWILNRRIRVEEKALGDAASGHNG